MNRTLFYDRDTGRLLHAHYEVRALDDPDERAPLSAPAAADPDAVLAELVARGLDPQRLGSLVTDEPPQSSRRVARMVDVATGELRSRRLRAHPRIRRSGRPTPEDHAETGD